MDNKYNYWLLLLFVIFSTAIFSQKQSKLNQEDYLKWHTLSGESLSPNGSWATYTFRYESGVDSTFVVEVETGKKILFAGASAAAFSPDSNMAVATCADSSLLLKILSKGDTKKIENVIKYEFERTGRFLAILQSEKNSQSLLILDNKAELILKIPDVDEFKLSDFGKFAVITKSKISIYDSERNYEVEDIILEPNTIYKRLSWNKKATFLAFLAQEIPTQDRNTKHSLFTYDVKKNKLSVLSETLTDRMKVQVYPQEPILADDGKQIFFFYTNKSLAKTENTIVEVWNASTKLVYPAEQYTEDPALMSKLAVWNLETDSVRIIATEELPMSLLTSDKKYVLTYSFLTNEPQYSIMPLVDFYITSVETGIKIPFLKNQSTAPYSMGSSPSGRYINYFKLNNWWVYDVVTGIHLNVTESAESKFIDSDSDGSEPNGYPSYGWTNDSKYLIVYDKYDIWLISADGKVQKRLTNGSQQKITFRICEQLYLTQLYHSPVDFIEHHFDLAKGLILSAKGQEHNSGFYHWKPNNTNTQIIYGSFRYSKIFKAAEAEKYLFTKESFEIPPAIYSLNIKNNVSKKLVQSNPHYSRYEWGRSEIMSFKNEKGRELEGALFYPAGYQKGKKYPMIVYIYSKLSQNVHEYVNPTMFQPIGFCPSVYTSDNYIVLMPDIEYAIGNPSPSIVDCVTSAVAKVVGMGIVNQEKIGLIGHSYGGYETCQIVAGTSMFAAAVAGASVTNMLSSYLSINSDTGKKMDWRFESQQYRMRSTPFDNLKGYLENSSVPNAANIQTPLLSWSGKEDMSVDWRQGIELHLSLRRLQKRNVFLAYPNQGHILTDPLAQLDLSVRIKNWFDHYLNEKPLQNDMKDLNQQ